MSSSSYDLTSSLDSDSGVKGSLKSIDHKLKEFVSQHHLLVSTFMLVLVILLIWALMRESFNPTSTLRMQQASFSGSEAMDTKSAIQQAVSKGADAKGGAGAFVLSSADFDCANRQSAGDDAWAWMNQEAGAEGMDGARKPQNDNDFSKILAGQ